MLILVNSMTDFASEFAHMHEELQHFLDIHRPFLERAHEQFSKIPSSQSLDQLDDLLNGFLKKIELAIEAIPDMAMKYAQATTPKPVEPEPPAPEQEKPMSPAQRIQMFFEVANKRGAFSIDETEQLIVLLGSVPVHDIASKSKELRHFADIANRKGVFSLSETIDFLALTRPHPDPVAPSEPKTVQFVESEDAFETI